MHYLLKIYCTFGFITCVFVCEAGCRFCYLFMLFWVIKWIFNCKAFVYFNYLVLRCLTGDLPCGFVPYFALLQHVYNTTTVAQENAWPAETALQITCNCVQFWYVPVTFKLNEIVNLSMWMSVLRSSSAEQ